ncbi:uncharacterized protein A4U43_C08F21750 [Asparagus officinalis]|nr:uncharacterized protein A4U43_C08F21750 [Asparagus officinalis]
MSFHRSDKAKDEIEVDLAVDSQILFWIDIVLGTLSIGILGYAVLRKFMLEAFLVGEVLDETECHISHFIIKRKKERKKEIGRPVPEAKGMIDTLPLLRQRFRRRAGDMKNDEEEGEEGEEEGLSKCIGKELKKLL